jgi:hypothetical protein
MWEHSTSIAIATITELRQVNTELHASNEAWTEHWSAKVDELRRERDGLKQANANLHTNLADRDRVVALCLEYDATIAELRRERIKDAETLLELRERLAIRNDTIAELTARLAEAERILRGHEAWYTGDSLDWDWTAAKRAFLAASLSQGQPTKARDDWQLVPKVLTEEMHEVARNIEDGPSVTYQEHWDAMLRAAASPAKASGDGGTDG